MAELVLVTGANGHLGSNTVRALLEKGYRVRAFVRKSSNLEGIKDLDIEIAHGDILDKESTLNAAKGCKFIIHHAAVYKFLGKTAEEIMEPAVIGTRNIFAAAAEEQVERLIYTSSTIAVGNADKKSDWRNEENWNEDDYVVYGMAKTKSEKLAWKLAEDLAVPTIVLNPGIIFGSHDYSITPSNQIIKNMATGFYLTAVGTWSMIDVIDVAEIHVLALKQGRIGERYLVISEVKDMKSVSKEVRKISGRFVFHSPLPRSLNIISCILLEKVLGLFKIETPVPAAMVKECSHRYANHDNSKLKEDFDIEFQNFEATIRKTIKWLVDRKELKLSKRVMQGLLETS